MSVQSEGMKEERRPVFVCTVVVIIIKQNENHDFVSSLVNLNLMYIQLHPSTRQGTIVSDNGDRV